MGDAEHTIEQSRFSQEQVDGAQLQIALYLFERTKPNQFQQACAIGERGFHPSRTPYAHFFHIHQLSLELHILHLFAQLTDGVEL